MTHRSSRMSEIIALVTMSRTWEREQRGTDNNV